MAVQDYALELANGQTLVGLGGAGTTVATTKSIALGAAMDAGDGESLSVEIYIPTTVTGDGTRAVSFSIWTSLDGNGVSGLLAKTRSFTTATLLGGKRITLLIPKVDPVMFKAASGGATPQSVDNVTLLGYLIGGVTVEVLGGGDFSSGTFSMRVQLQVDSGDRFVSPGMKVI